MQTEIVKFLGAYPDIRMTWKGHIENSKSLPVVFDNKIKVRSYQTDVLRTVYFSIFYSAMSYAILAWGRSCHRENWFSNVILRLCRIYKLSWPWYSA